MIHAVQYSQNSDSVNLRKKSTYSLICQTTKLIKRTATKSPISRFPDRLRKEGTP